MGWFMFLRAYDSYGGKIGSNENEEKENIIESQGWCIIGGAGLANGYACKALESVRQLLATFKWHYFAAACFSKYICILVKSVLLRRDKRKCRNIHSQ